VRRPPSAAGLRRPPRQPAFGGHLRRPAFGGRLGASLALAGPRRSLVVLILEAPPFSSKRRLGLRAAACRRLDRTLVPRVGFLRRVGCLSNCERSPRAAKSFVRPSAIAR